MEYLLHIKIQTQVVKLDVCVVSLLLQSTVDKLIKKTNLALVVGTNSWRDQFMEAITVSAGKLCSGFNYRFCSLENMVVCFAFVLQ